MGLSHDLYVFPDIKMPNIYLHIDYTSTTTTTAIQQYNSGSSSTDDPNPPIP